MRKDRWSGGLLCVSCSVSSDLVGLVLLLVAPQDGLREACLPLNSGYCWRGGVGSWNLSLFIRWAPLHIPSASFWVGLLCSVPLNFWSDKQQVDITVNTFFFFWKYSEHCWQHSVVQNFQWWINETSKREAQLPEQHQSISSMLFTSKPWLGIAQLKILTFHRQKSWGFLSNGCHKKNKQSQQTKLACILSKSRKAIHKNNSKELLKSADPCRTWATME